MKTIITTLALLCATPVFSQTVDGTLDAEYGEPNTVQNTQTGLWQL